MTKTTLPFAAPDISGLAKTLSRELRALETPPGHVQLLNILARAAGHRNYQAMKAQHDAGPPTFGWFLERAQTVLRRASEMMPLTANATRNTMNRIFAIPAAVPAIPPKPNSAATSAITRNTTDQ